MPCYLKVPSIKGNVTAKGYENAIEIFSLHFIVRRPALMRVGQCSSRKDAKPCFSEVTLTKALDCASNALFDLACNGHFLDTVEVEAATAGDTLTPYLRYVLHNVVVSSYEPSCVKDVFPSETLHLSYTKLELHYLGASRKIKQTPQRSCYDLETAQLV